MRVVFEVRMVAIHDDQPAFIAAYPILIAVVQPREIVYSDAFLELSASLPNVIHQRGYARTNVNHQVGQADKRYHQVEKVGVVGEVAVAHHAHGVEIRGKDACVFKDCAVLNDGVLPL